MEFEFAGCAVGQKTSKPKVDPSSTELDLKLLDGVAPKSEWGEESECKASAGGALVSMKHNPGYLRSPLPNWGDDVLCMYVDGRLVDWLPPIGRGVWVLTHTPDPTKVQSTVRGGARKTLLNVLMI